MLKNMQYLANFGDVTLVSEDNERIRAHNVVLTSVSTPSGTWSKMGNILKKCKILKVKSTGKTNKFRCSLYNHGFYKASPGCMFDQPDMDFETENVTNNTE